MIDTTFCYIISIHIWVIRAFRNAKEGGVICPIIFRASVDTNLRQFISKSTIDPTIWNTKPISLIWGISISRAVIDTISCLSISPIARRTWTNRHTPLSWVISQLIIWTCINTAKIRSISIQIRTNRTSKHTSLRNRISKSILSIKWRTRRYTSLWLVISE